MTVWLFIVSGLAAGVVLWALSLYYVVLHVCGGERAAEPEPCPPGSLCGVSLAGIMSSADRRLSGRMARPRLLEASGMPGCR